ncbi:MAG: AbrB/MazE/SpoVT family DNA-binding domain-containing protein [Edaphobacter sp.]|uniref:AbrB/MazE/SpoVT family DNA-binding domain-containing protein n=1 Tax=Edaphobacter sp. TaxID=1934404 RepID=UPI0023A7447E|nr:AbrB/MazE/SpoVT family DNA-binding domain-containing protein [Edaphobacter sp.]MDE1176889.1 AbrB/MazE/SpoVT family DNA-binding domain-containing protein [Edaphobacter sp.]
MATTAKVISIGNSIGIVLPKEIAARLHVEKGDTVYLSENPDGVHLSVYDEALARKLDAMEQVMRENRDVLRRLAE